MQKMICFFIIVMVSFLGFSEAKEWVYKQTGFKFWLPDNWKTNWAQERSCFSGWDEKGKMEFDFFAPTKIRNLNTAAQYLIDEIDDWWISDIQLGNVHKGNINGLSCLYVEGKGISKRQSYAGWEEGAQIAFIAAIYQKDTQVLMMVGYAPDEKEEVSKNEIVEDDNEEDDNEEDDNEEDDEYKYIDREDLAIFVKILTSVKK